MASSPVLTSTVEAVAAPATVAVTPVSSVSVLRGLYRKYGR